MPAPTRRARSRGTPEHLARRANVAVVIGSALAAKLLVRGWLSSTRLAHTS
ncbi:MAG: hypothetical protein ACRDRU_27170 [Pseudonocardiaceae bacterium]